MGRSSGAKGRVTLELQKRFFFVKRQTSCTLRVVRCIQCPSSYRQQRQQPIPSPCKDVWCTGWSPVPVVIRHGPSAQQTHQKGWLSPQIHMSPVGCVMVSRPEVHFWTNKKPLADGRAVMSRGAFHPTLLLLSLFGQCTWTLPRLPGTGASSMYAPGPVNRCHTPVRHPLLRRQNTTYRLTFSSLNRLKFHILNFIAGGTCSAFRTVTTSCGSVANE